MNLTEIDLEKDGALKTFRLNTAECAVELKRGASPALWLMQVIDPAGRVSEINLYSEAGISGTIVSE